MSRLVLVRHGQAAAGWGEDPDPGLDDVGRAQAEALGRALAPDGPLPVVVSPLRRTRETAPRSSGGGGSRPWSSPASARSARRSTSSRRAPRGSVMCRGVRWPEQDDALQRWRAAILAVLASLDRATVVVTHFFAINAAVGAATGDDRLVCFRPDHCSRTVLDNDGGRLRLVERGAEHSTAVL